MSFQFHSLSLLLYLAGVIIQALLVLKKASTVQQAFRNVDEVELPQTNHSIKRRKNACNRRKSLHCPHVSHVS